MLYAYRNDDVDTITVLYRLRKRVYLMLLFNPVTKEIQTGQWLKHTDIKHHMSHLNSDGTFTYVTLNYSTVPNRHNEGGCGYRCTCTPPLFTANSPEDFKWFQNCWSSSYGGKNNMIELSTEDKSYIEKELKEVDPPETLGWG